MFDKYDLDDICTFYFVIYDDGKDTRIQAYSDNKEYVDAYMNFHKCKYYKVKKRKDKYKNIIDIINENFHDEIELYNIKVKSNKKGEDYKFLALPMTSTEQMLISDECQSFISTRIDYSFIESQFYYLKRRYQQALKDIFLFDVMNKVIHEKQSLFTNIVELDQLMVLFRSFPEHFGK